VVPWHWATEPTRVRALAHHTSIVVSWHPPTNLKSGQLIGWDILVNGNIEHKVTSRRITLSGLKGGKLYRINVSAITQDPNGSATQISGDQSTTFVKTS
jgi:hypothetical protein